MEETTDSEKLNENLGASQLEGRNGESDDLTIKAEILINISLHQLMKQEKIGKKIYHRLRTTVSELASFYALAKVYKNGTRCRPFLSIPGINFDSLKNFLYLFFQRLPGAIVEKTQKKTEPL